MFKNLSLDVAAWWETVTPEFAFLLGLFFAVVAAGLAGEWLRQRSHGHRAPSSHSEAQRRRRRAAPGT